MGLASLASTANAAEQAPIPAAAIEFFEGKVRPVLVDSCIKCHGPDKQSSGLRVDSREALLEGGENGPSIVPGDPDKSLLIQAMRFTHEDFRMPPKAKLPDPVVDGVAEWVRQGAPWPQGKVLAPAARDRVAETHWAFRPLAEVTPPKVADPAGWGKTPVDAFVLAKLNEKGMSPSAPADKRTLIRRATFDLTGLPPTAAEIAAFEADHSPDAFSRVVDRLLASPRYGERWGRHWLDVARYADTKGYVFTEDRRYPFAYTYRDYVVRAFNNDLPYNQFIVEQIAADRLPPSEDNRAQAALGFLTVGRRFLNDQNDIIDDRIDVVTRGLLGLTVACARCHDHKYDPIPTDDYYSLHGIFASSFEPGELPVLKGGTNEDAQLDYEKKSATLNGEYQALVAGQLGAIQADLHARVGAYLKFANEMEFKADNPKLRDRNLPTGGLPRGRLRLQLEAWKNFLAKPESKNDPVFAPLVALLAIPDAELAAKGPEILSGLAASKVAVNPLVAKLVTEPKLANRGDLVARYADLLAQTEQRWSERIKAGNAQSLAEPEWEGIRLALYAPTGPLKLKDGIFPPTLGEFAENKIRFLTPEDRAKFAALKNRDSQLQATNPGAPARAMVMNDAPQPVNPHVFVRGNPGRPGKEVPRQFLKVLSPPDRKPFQNGSGRLDLAKSIADPKNPLTVRVIVNRIWLQHFGVGLVSTPSDFGVRSDPPSHPELLDYLSQGFLKENWSIKSVHRAIMLSSTYQQGSDNNLAYLERDPEDRLLWKFPKRRLDFESMRDAFLAVSGQLDPTIGGRSVMIGEAPYPPRRTIYGFIDRQNLDGVYRTFDFASPDATSARRFVTTVPQQALFLMNSPFVVEQARALTASVASTTGDEKRIKALYRRIFGREAEASEIKVGIQFLNYQSQKHSTPVATWQFGFGSFDESTRQVAKFEHFAHWTGTAWQAGPVLPDPTRNFLNLNAGGGHVGSDGNHAAIRRWVAPRDAQIQVDATLQHDSPNGDGVRGRVVASRAGELGSWVAHNAKVNTRIDAYDVKKGETIDFVVDCRATDAFDSFVWSPVIREIQPTRAEWTATSGFQGPPPQALSPWDEYVQVLLLTNEFMFVD
ncbi:PSD1 and planctomycete cytochrome C domain-containing protein [Singulisphaera sp. PoT]|uniref:PSD1 and planctomycete cytochrome C domain-containing protein n=1 Tax=Singulisphaera sp. PoT TaxID=3411797 RepID=UPI003BF4C17C